MPIPKTAQQGFIEAMLIHTSHCGLGGFRRGSPLRMCIQAFAVHTTQAHSWHSYTAALVGVKKNTVYYFAIF